MNKHQRVQAAWELEGEATIGAGKYTHEATHSMSKLIESQTTEVLPNGSTLTTLHLTEEARRGLSINGARISSSSTTYAKPPWWQRWKWWR